MRTVSTTLAAEQTTKERTPAFALNFSVGGDLSDRLLDLKHTEAPYLGVANMVLDNYDRAIPSDITGSWVEIGYGDHTSAGNETSPTARLWVKRQRNISSPSGLFTNLYLEDGWETLGEDPVNIGSGADLYYVYNKTQTIYAILYNVLAGMGFSLPTSPPSAYDGIIQTSLLYWEINAQPFENRREFVKRLISNTKCYIRMKPNRVCEIVYPQSADSVQLTYSSASLPQFYEFIDGHSLVIPNIEHVEANQDQTTGLWPSRIEGTATDSAQIARYMSIPRYSWAELITNLTDANNLASALLIKSQQQASGSAGVVSHDCRVELYDKVAFSDSRGQAAVTYPSDAMSRVTALKHIYNRAKGIYRLVINMGGLTTYPLDWEENTPHPRKPGHEVDTINEPSLPIPNKGYGHEVKDPGDFVPAFTLADPLDPLKPYVPRGRKGR